ncbi:MAG: type II toxin-antitoxin system RelE/ParE family toxin [Acidobacteria bacterium]|nr:type II toxin-antitoxin system RelE/ParE family toxin [Acidobacteriota bacterium]
MAEYAVGIKTSALKELGRLESDIVERIFDRIRGLGQEPRPSGCKKLKGDKESWRLRVGDYRVIYTIDDKTFRIDITRIRHRKDAY